MVRKSSMGRGHLWSIHHSSLEYFRECKYNCRDVNKLVQQWHNNNRSDNTTDSESTSQMAMGEPSSDTNRDDSTSSTAMTAAAASPQQQNASAAHHLRTPTEEEKPMQLNNIKCQQLINKYLTIHTHSYFCRNNDSSSVYYFHAKRIVKLESVVDQVSKIELN